MHDSADQLGRGPAQPQPGLTRRQVIARGAAGGAALWAVPTLQIIGATAADAASGPGVPPSGGGGPVDPPPAPTEGLPGHGLALVDGGAGAFVVKIDSGATGALSGLGNQDERFLREAHDVVEGRDYRQPTPADLAAFGVAGNGFGATWHTPEGASEPQAALFLVLPSGHDVRRAFTFDGSLQTPGNGIGNGNGNGRAKGRPEGCGDGDKYTDAHVSGRLVYFVAACNEPATDGD